MPDDAPSPRPKGRPKSPAAPPRVHWNQRVRAEYRDWFRARAAERGIDVSTLLERMARLWAVVEHVDEPPPR